MASSQASGSSDEPTAHEPSQAIRTIQKYVARCTQCAWAGNRPMSARKHVLTEGHLIKESRETILEPV